MIRWSAILLVAFAALPVIADEEEVPAMPRFVTEMAGRLVRAGCGRRLYLIESFYHQHENACVLSDDYGGEPSTIVRTDGVLVRKPGTEKWQRIDAPAGLLWPEIFGTEPFTVTKGKPGGEEGARFVLVPKTETGRQFLTRIRVSLDRRSQLKEVELEFPDGQREFRTWLSKAGMIRDVVEIPAAADKVAWPPEVAWGSRAETVLEALSAKVKKYESITGNYVREKRTQLLLKPVVAAGEFRFVPGRLLWIDEEPRPSRVLITREKMEVYDPKNLRLERFSFGDSKLGDYVFIGFGDSAATAFRSFRPLAFEMKDDVVTLRCRPVAGALKGHIEELTLAIDAKTGLMKRLSYVDPSGDSVSTKVLEVRTDRGLTAKDVGLTPAKGTRIIENTGEMPWR